MLKISVRKTATLVSLLSLMTLGIFDISAHTLHINGKLIIRNKTNYPFLQISQVHNSGNFATYSKVTQEDDSSGDPVNFPVLSKGKAGVIDFTNRIPDRINGLNESYDLFIVYQVNAVNWASKGGYYMIYLQGAKFKSTKNFPEPLDVTKNWLGIQNVSWCHHLTNYNFYIRAMTYWLPFPDSDIHPLILTMDTSQMNSYFSNGDTHGDSHSGPLRSPDTTESGHPHLTFKNPATKGTMAPPHGIAGEKALSVSLKALMHDLVIVLDVNFH